MNATLASKGRITVPVEIRNQLGLQAGDRLDFQLKEGKVELTKVSGSLDSFIATLPKAKKPFTTELINEAIPVYDTTRCQSCGSISRRRGRVSPHGARGWER